MEVMLKFMMLKGIIPTNQFLLSGGKSIRNVSGATILVKDGSYIKYYDFEGRYTNKSTPDR